MSDHIQQAIDSLEHEIEAIDQRRGELQRAIDAMRPLASDGRSIRKVSTTKKKALKRNERTNERTNEQSAGQRGQRDGASLTARPRKQRGIRRRS